MHPQKVDQRPIRDVWRRQCPSWPAQSIQRHLNVTKCNYSDSEHLASVQATCWGRSLIHPRNAIDHWRETSTLDERLRAHPFEVVATQRLIARIRGSQWRWRGWELRGRSSQESRERQRKGEVHVLQRSRQKVSLCSSVVLEATDLADESGS